MSKYSFDRMLPEQFESMAQALLEKLYRVQGNLIQFGSGTDGGREATWTQTPGHLTYKRPRNERKEVAKEWVFQVKYHDISQRGWGTARDSLVSDLDKELEKIIKKHKVPCHSYVMITNVPFTGARNVGTRDKIQSVAKRWLKHIPEIYVWDAADLSRMLDANEDVRTAYFDSILPGDVLKSILKGATFHDDRSKAALRAYLKFVTERERFARAEEAGDEPGLPLEQVFMDLPLRPLESSHEEVKKLHATWPSERENKNIFSANRFMPNDYDRTPASFALLLAEYPSILLLGGPGLGKSTLTQFLTLYHAARVVDPDLALKVAELLKLPHDIDAKHLDSYCKLRFPLRIELRRYARWMAEEAQQNKLGELARYIADVMINPNVSGSLTMDDVFALTSTDPILLILDGLDEVPNYETRQQILHNLQIFLRRTEAEHGDIVLLLSSRPKGYSGEFEIFQPLAWELNELERADFDEYCARWLGYRVRDAEERREAGDRIDRGMKSESVQLLARSLLQATVMLTIVRRKSEIPHQRHALYNKYVNVIFDREKEKSPVVRDRAAELLQLHERVGYELHRRMEQTRVESIDQESFRTFVLHVLEDYSGSQLGDKKLKEVADEIITAATDRLCMLVGKGKEQTDIDFVVQSFREYFAAAFLFNHPEADSEKVFRTLVRRGAFWGDVLQFYVAQASANQQIRWITSADGNGYAVTTTNDLIGLVRLRRAICGALPELNLHRRADFDRTLKIVFAANTRWTWAEQWPSLNILSILRSGTAAQTVWDILKEPTVHDELTLVAELNLLAALTRDNPKERRRFHVLLQNLVRLEKPPLAALQTALEHDADIDLSSCSVDVLRRAAYTSMYRFHRTSRAPKTILVRQSPEKLCEILYADWWVRSQDLASAPEFLRTLEAVSHQHGLDLFDGKVQISIPPFLCKRDISVDLTAPASLKLEKYLSPYAKYFSSLLNAAGTPTDLEKDQKARDLEERLPLPKSHQWNTEFILGPSAKAFPSPAAWHSYSELRSQIIRKEDWIEETADFSKSELWHTLLFHPDDWLFLVACGLISQRDHDRLRRSSFGRLMSYPNFPFDLSYGWSTESSKHTVQISRIIHVALSIAENHGVARMGNGSVLNAVVTGRKLVGIAKNDTDELLQRAVRIDGLPRNWVNCLLQVASMTPDVGIKALLDLWKKYEPVLFPDGDFFYDSNKLVERLLTYEEECALSLAACLVWKNGDQHLKLQVHDKIVQKLPDMPVDHFRTHLFLHLLLSFTPSLEEFIIWQMPQYRRGLIRDDRKWIIHRMADRIRNSLEFDIDHRKLRDQFTSFITHRAEFPPEIARAALEATLKLDERAMATLEDDEWLSAAPS